MKKSSSNLCISVTESWSCEHNVKINMSQNAKKTYLYDYRYYVYDCIQNYPITMSIAEMTTDDWSWRIRLINTISSYHIVISYHHQDIVISYHIEKPIPKIIKKNLPRA
jgi:hypothetical protein